MFIFLTRNATIFDFIAHFRRAWLGFQLHRIFCIFVFSTTAAKVLHIPIFKITSLTSLDNSNDDYLPLFQKVSDLPILRKPNGGCGARASSPIHQIAFVIDFYCGVIFT